MLVIILAKLIGMLRDVVLANYFGTTNVSDAYLIAGSVPTLLFYFIGHSISTAFLPMYNKVLHSKGEKAAQKYANNLLTVSLLLSTVIVAVLMLFPEIVVKLFASGFDQETVQLTSKIIRQSAASLYLMTFVSVWTGYLQAKNNFIIPASISLPRNLVIMASIVCAATFDVSALGWGLLIAYIGELLLMLPFVLKKGYRYTPIVALGDEDLKETLNLVVPIILGVGVSQINKIVDKSVASSVTVGGVSALNYASVINNAIQEILVTGIITILFAKCSEMVAKGLHDQVKSKLSQTLEVMILLLLPASVGIVLLAKPIVVCFLSRGIFDEASVALTSGALVCYTIGLLFMAVRDTLVKVFYSYKETRITTITATTAIAINVGLNLLLSRWLGISGLALATSISSVFHCVAMYFLLRKRIGDYGSRIHLQTVAKASLAAFVMAIAIKAIQFFFAERINSSMIELLICVGAGIVVYGIFVVVLKVPVVNDFIRKLRGIEKS